jgi:hypothetical protein
VLSGMRFPRNRKNIREGYTLAFWNRREFDPPTPFRCRIPCQIVPSSATMYPQHTICDIMLKRPVFGSQKSILCYRQAQP